jgi:Protein of unknown function (DUF3465)
MLSRNPVIAAMTAATLLLSGCGVATHFAGATVTKTGITQAQKAKKAKKNVEEPVTPSANKDWKLVEGEVSKLLPDDNSGSRHQHFLVKVTPKQTIKIAHNIDLAAYVPVKVGDKVEIKCEYIKASPYDVAHWTHYDPRGGEGGYIKLNGKIYDRL